MVQQRLFLFCTVFLLAFSMTKAQSTDERKFKLAESYEKSGDMKSAARLYQELYATDKRSSAYFQGMRRTFFALSQFSAMIPIVEEQLSFKKTSELYALYGDVLWKSGKPKDADEAWTQGIALARGNENAFYAVAQAQIDNRAFDKAIATLIKARKESDKPAIFGNELSQLYGAVGNYAAGTQEALGLLKQSSNLAQAQGRISAYLATEKGVEQSRKVLEAAVASESGNMILYQLFAWYLREIKDYDRALTITETIDTKINANGRELLMFGDLAQREGFPDAAQKAYSAVIAKGKTNPYAMPALFGYARSMEARLRVGEKLERKEVEAILERYRQIIRDYPATQFSADSQYRIATLTADFLQNYDRAIEEFNRLINGYRAMEVAAKGANDLARLYVQHDNLVKSEELFRMIVKTFSHFSDERDKALFGLAELDFFRGNIDSAKEEYGRLAVNANMDIANDALERISLLEDAKDNPALKIYAQAELKFEQKKFEEAAELSKTIIATEGAKELAERSFVRLARIEFDQKRFVSAREFAGKLVEKFPESIFGDTAFFLMGEAFSAENNKPSAIEAFTKILEKYPRSTLLQSARIRIRKLRGDA